MNSALYFGPDGNEGVGFVGFFSYGCLGESIMAISEFYELYGVQWGWGYGWLTVYWGTEET